GTEVVGGLDVGLDTDLGQLGLDQLHRVVAHVAVGGAQAEGSDLVAVEGEGVTVEFVVGVLENLDGGLDVTGALRVSLVVVAEVFAVVAGDVVVLQVDLGVRLGEVAGGDRLPIDRGEDRTAQLDVLEPLVLQVEVDVLPHRTLGDGEVDVGQVLQLGDDV